MPHDLPDLPGTDERFKLLESLYKKRFAAKLERVAPMHPHASDRQLFRLFGRSGAVIGVINPNVAENEAFYYFTEYFRKLGLRAPELYEIDKKAYLEEDLGDTSLYDVLDQHRSEFAPFPEPVHALYEEAISTLPRFQVIAAHKLDFGRCYPHREYGRAAMTEDLQAFVKQFVQRATPEVTIEYFSEDFTALLEPLCYDPGKYFMYRDFQSRNIMVTPQGLAFIDYQGGRRGPLPYDVVSLLYQASARIPPEVRAKLLVKYLEVLKEFAAFSQTRFLASYRGFIIARMLQVLGVYGREGLHKRKEYFLSSIPLALGTLADILSDGSELPVLPSLQAYVSRLRERQEAW